MWESLIAVIWISTGCTKSSLTTAVELKPKPILSGIGSVSVYALTKRWGPLTWTFCSPIWISSSCRWNRRLESKLDTIESKSRLQCVRLLLSAPLMELNSELTQNILSIHLSTLQRFIELKTIWRMEFDGSINQNCAVKSREQSCQGRAARGESWQ